jgi:hypothetical protein
MRRSMSRILVALVTAAALGAAVPAASAAPAAEPGGQAVAAPMAQSYYWDWSDGQGTLSRTFNKSEFGDQASLPHLIVTVKPASPKRVVYLKFKQDGKWLLEGKRTTSSKGVATLDFDPWCDADETNWCDGTWTYRVSIGSAYKTFKVTFSES